MLRLGAGRDLVGELTALTAQHPLRERFRQQLMVALYRADRQGDALAAYWQAREYLAEALGVAPSPELDQMHARILRQDRGLDAPTAGGPVAPSLTAPPLAVASPPVAVAGPPLAALVRPAQLPMDVHGFVGREHQLAALSTLLPELGTEHSTIICVIAGTAGVGKTTLAVHWAHRVRGLFPDGQLYINLRGFDPSGSALSPDEATWSFLDALGVPPERIPVGLAARTAVYRSLLAGRQMLVVVDNARRGPGAPASARPGRMPGTGDQP